MAVESKQHDYQYLPIQCPNCGAEGKVRIQRLDRTFLCKHCKKNFHVDPDGVITGERPPDVDESEHIYSAPLPPPKPSLIERIWAKLPGAGQMAVAGAVLLGATAWFLHWMLTPAPELPESLNDRATLLVESVIARDATTASYLYSSDTARDGKQWYGRMRAVLSGEIKSMSSEILFREGIENGQRAGVAVTVALAQSGQTKSRYVVTYWIQQGGDMHWLLDGKRTLAEAPKEL